MKLALVDGEKIEATKGVKAECQYCGSELIARCGEVRVNHWAHKGIRKCDPWWENETEWHRSWKDNFPKDWQEVIRFDEESGEKHIADVKTDSGWVIEFQHSYLNPEERRLRNAFYRNIVWVVNGLRRKADVQRFEAVLREGTAIWKAPLIIEIHFPEESRLLSEWGGGNSLVFFDFQEMNAAKQEQLWFLYPNTKTNKAYVSPFSRCSLIESMNNNKFDEIVDGKIIPILNILTKQRHTQFGSMRLIRPPRYGRHERL